MPIEQQSTSTWSMIPRMPAPDLIGGGTGVRKKSCSDNERIGAAPGLDAQWFPNYSRRMQPNEDRRSLRKWTVWVAIAYGGFALALLLFSFATTNGLRPTDATRAEASNQPAEPVSAWRPNGTR
jgi:hypothetical protein